MNDFESYPKASTVVKAIQALIKKHGDLPICADDPDTDWRMQVGIVFRAENKKEDWPDRFEIKTDYHIDPDGMIRKEKSNE